MRLVFIYMLLLLFSMGVTAQVKFDSLWSVWNNEKMADTARLQAMHKIAWDGYLFSKPDSAFHFAQLEYELAEKITNEKWMAEAWNTQGVSLWIQGNYDKAMEYYTKSLKIREKRNDKKGIASSLGNMGLIYSGKGEYITAIEYFEKSLKICEETNNKRGMANALGNIGIVYSEQGNYAKAIDYYSRELKIKEEIDDKRGMANVLNNIGVVYLEQKDYEKAIEYYTKSLGIREALNDKRGVALTMNNIGLIYNDQRDFEKAMEYFTGSMAIYEEIGDRKGVSQTLNNIGIIYKEEKNYVEAINYYARSLKINEELEDKRSMSISLINISNISNEQGQYNKAVTNGLSAIRMASESGAIKQIELAAKALYESYKALNQHQKALSMHELYMSMRDSIQREENEREVIRQEYKYQFEKEALADSIKSEEAKKVLDVQIEVQKAELKYQRTQKYVLYGGVLVLLLFGGYTYNRFNKTQAQKLIIEKQKATVEEAHREMTASITYAKRIQNAILPPHHLLEKHFGESFVLYKPKDVVAGDFYWMERQKDRVMIAAADCTGHGVPGALVSVICNNGLKRSVREYGLTDPGEILDKTRAIVIQEFEKSAEDVKDGMDIALCVIEGKKLRYAGAHNPLWVMRNNSIIEIKADKQPIGKFEFANPFTTHTIELEKADSIYIFTDGYVDQFGGPHGKKFMARPLKKLLLGIQEKTMEEQRQILNETFENWRGNENQVDDVCFIGIRVT